MTSILPSPAGPSSVLAIVQDLIERGDLPPSTLERMIDHQMAMERSESQREWAGLAAAWTISIAFLIVSAYVITSGYEVGGTILGTVDLVALVAVFVTGRGNPTASRVAQSG